MPHCFDSIVTTWDEMGGVVCAIVCTGQQAEMREDVSHVVAPWFLFGQRFVCTRHAYDVKMSLQANRIGD